MLGARRPRRAGIHNPPCDRGQPGVIHDSAHHRAHTATANQPPANLAPTTITNVMMQNT